MQSERDLMGVEDMFNQIIPSPHDVACANYGRDFCHVQSLNQKQRFPR